MSCLLWLKKQTLNFRVTPASLAHPSLLQASCLWEKVHPAVLTLSRVQGEGTKQERRGAGKFFPDWYSDELVSHSLGRCYRWGVLWVLRNHSITGMSPQAKLPWCGWCFLTMAHPMDPFSGPGKAELIPSRTVTSPWQGGPLGWDLRQSHLFFMLGPTLVHRR